MEKVMYLVLLFIYQDGEPEDSEKGYSLRPIVSINLKESGCSLIERTEDDGKRKFELKWSE